jgi:hypothetical protein
MQLQIVDFNYKNYNVKCGYCKGIVTYVCRLIQTHDDNKTLTPNVGIAIGGFFLPMILYFHFGPFNVNCT